VTQAIRHRLWSRCRTWVGGCEHQLSNVVLTDGKAGGITVGTQTIAGLPGCERHTHHQLEHRRGRDERSHPDGDARGWRTTIRATTPRAIAITVNPQTFHVGNLDGGATSNGNNWSATVRLPCTTPGISRERASVPSLERVLILRWDASRGDGNVQRGLSNLPNSTRLVSFG